MFLNLFRFAKQFFFLIYDVVYAQAPHDKLANLHDKFIQLISEYSNLPNWVNHKFFITFLALFLSNFVSIFRHENIVILLWFINFEFMIIGSK